MLMTRTCSGEVFGDNSGILVFLFLHKVQGIPTTYVFFGELENYQILLLNKYSVMNSIIVTIRTLNI